MQGYGAASSTSCSLSPGTEIAMMRVLEHETVDAVDARAVLAAVLALHDAPGPLELIAALPRLVADLIPYESFELIGGFGAPRPRPAAHDDHSLAIRTPGAGGTLVGVVLGRRRPFTRHETAIAGLLGPHLGAAVDHARLRAAHRALAGSSVAEALTLREREVLALVADGRRDRDIALALHIGPRTVEKHVEHIRAKLGARSRAEAVARWARASA